MKALAKRVNARGGAMVLTTTLPTSSDIVEKRGPRNQPKRKGRK